MDPTALMEQGRFAEAAVLYERLATEAQAARDLAKLKGSATMAVKAYAYAEDGPNALRIAIAAASALAAEDVQAFARQATKVLQDQGLDDAAQRFKAHVETLVGSAPPPQLAAFCSSCGERVDPRTVLMPQPNSFACRKCGASLNR